MFKAKCSVCGEPWVDCAHAQFEDIHRHKQVKWALRIGSGLLVLAAVTLLIVMPMMVLFS